MRCLVTGVAGFVGSHLAERLLAEGHEVCGVDAFIDYYPRQLKEKNLEALQGEKHFTFLEGNLLHLNLSDLVKNVDWIFHQAAQASVRASWGNKFSQYVECNIVATQLLLEATLHHGHVQRFVYASSSSVYGNVTTLPVSEDIAPAPISPYGVTKLAAENLCTLYYRNFGVPTVSLRYFTVYGPRQRPDMAFHRFCKAAIEQHPIRIYDDGEQTRDFTYISDVVDANIRSATADAAVGEVLNIAGGARVTVKHVLHLLEELCKHQLPIVFEQQQHGDVRDTFAATTRAQQIIGYQPHISLQEGLAHEFMYFSSIYGANTCVHVP